jgi:hypothetical protein
MDIVYCSLYVLKFDFSAAGRSFIIRLDPRPNSSYLFFYATFYRADTSMRNFVIVLRGRIAGGG